MIGPEAPHRRDVGAGADLEGNRKDSAAHRREGHRGPPLLVGPEERRAERLLELVLLCPLALVRSHGVDHALERQGPRRRDHRLPHRDHAPLGDDSVPFLAESRTRRTRDDGRHTPAVGELSVGRVHDRVRRLLQQVRRHDLEHPASGVLLSCDDVRIQCALPSPGSGQQQDLPGRLPPLECTVSLGSLGERKRLPDPHLQRARRHGPEHVG